MTNDFSEFTFIPVASDNTLSLEEVADNSYSQCLADIAQFFLDNPDAGSVTCEMMFKTDDGVLHVFKEDSQNKDEFWETFPFGVEDSGLHPNVSIDEFLIGATAYLNRI